MELLGCMDQLVLLVLLVMLLMFTCVYGAKVFVNICQSEAVAMATSSGPCTEGKKKGEQWQIPFSLMSGSEDLDKGKATTCLHGTGQH